METAHEHQHVHYRIEMTARHWWGGRVVYTVEGIGSSQQGGELLIHLHNGGMWSINYAGVYRMIATPLAKDARSHP